MSGVCQELESINTKQNRQIWCILQLQHLRHTQKEYKVGDGPDYTSSPRPSGLHRRPGLRTKARVHGDGAAGKGA